MRCVKHIPMKQKTATRILEFVLFGIVTGVIESTLSIYIFGERLLSVNELALLVLIVIPFAALEELVVDHPSFWKKIFTFCGVPWKTPNA